MSNALPGVDMRSAALVANIIGISFALAGLALYLYSRIRHGSPPPKGWQVTVALFALLILVQWVENEWMVLGLSIAVMVLSISSLRNALRLDAERFASRKES